MLEKWIFETSDDKVSLELIKSLVKKCPECSLSFSKDKHCNHMVCPGCQHHFCWLCLEPFIISEKHPSFDSCLVTDSKVQDKKQLSVPSIGKMKFYQYKYKKGYELSNFIMKTIRENDYSNCKHFKYVNNILQQEMFNQQYLSWAFVFEFFLNNPKDIEIWKITKNRLETSTTSFIEFLKMTTSGSYTDYDVSEMTKMSAISTKLISNMNDIQQNLEGDLSYTTNCQTDQWCCVHCETTHSSKIDMCNTKHCNTCRRHGIQECLMTDCKKPTWICSMCSFEQSIQITICQMCNIESISNI